MVNVYGITERKMRRNIALSKLKSISSQNISASWSSTDTSKTDIMVQLDLPSELPDDARVRVSLSTVLFKNGTNPTKTMPVFYEDFNKSVLIDFSNATTNGVKILKAVPVDTAGKQVYFALRPRGSNPTNKLNLYLDIFDPNKYFYSVFGTTSVPTFISSNIYTNVDDILWTPS